MADHLRKQIRDKLETELTGLGKTGSNVFPSRVYPMESAGLPGLVIFTGDEEVENETTTRPRLQRRELRVVIETYAKQVDTLDDELDASCNEIEKAIAADVTLGGLSKDAYLESTEYDLTGEGNKPAGVARLEYIVTYTVRENAPDVAI